MHAVQSLVYFPLLRVLLIPIYCARPPFPLIEELENDFSLYPLAYVPSDWPPLALVHDRGIACFSADYILAMSVAIPTLLLTVPLNLRLVRVSGDVFRLKR